jgi:pilus assembly protein Flp/PilA
VQLPRGLLTGRRPERGQALVEYALILALIALVVIIMLLLTGKQVTNLYSNITATMCNYHVGCG